MESIQLKIFNYIFDLEDLPICIYRLWRSFKINEQSEITKSSFIKLFFELPYKYPSFQIVFHKGCPFILYTKKEIWQFIDEDFILEDSNEITINDIIQYFIDDDTNSKIHKSFVIRLIEDGKLEEIKIIFQYFSFTQDELDEFLNCIIQKKDWKTLETIIFLVKKKYEIVNNTWIQRKNDMENNFNLMKQANKEQKIEFDLLQSKYQILKYINVITLGLLVIRCLF